MKELIVLVLCIEMNLFGFFSFFFFMRERVRENASLIHVLGGRFGLLIKSISNILCLGSKDHLAVSVNIHMIGILLLGIRGGCKMCATGSMALWHFLLYVHSPWEGAYESACVFNRCTSQLVE